MGHYVTTTCDQCSGARFIDDYYDSEIGKWIQRDCPKCSGLGEISVWVEDDNW